MGKTLRTAALIVGAAALIATGAGAIFGVAAVTAALGGVSAALLTVVAGALSVGASFFTPKGPKVSSSTTSRLNADIDPRTARKGVFGHTAMNTDIRDEEYTGSNKEYFHRFIVAASHKLTAMSEIWFDDQLAWTLAGGVQGAFVGYLTVDIILEGSPANAINISSRMGSSRRYTGCGYVHFRFKLTGNSSKAESPFSSSVPTRLTMIGDGMPVYDPRYDSTVPGGSGSARANDQTTWAYSYSGSASGRNPACQTLTYLLGWRIQNPVTSAWKLALGKGVLPERINLPSFITGANMCDESVTLAVGGTEPRYRSDGVFSEFDQATDVLDNLKAAMSGELDDMDGQIRLTVMHNDLGSPILNITDDDVLADFQWTPFASLESSRNVVRGNYVDASTKSLYQMVPYPDVAIASPDGIERAEPVNYQFVQSVSQAQRLSKQRLQRLQYSGVFQAQFKSRLWRAIKGDAVTFTFSPTAFAGKLFRVTDADVAVNGVVSIVLGEEHANIYLWDAEESPAVVPVDNSPFTNLDLPFVQALQDLSALGIVGYLTNESHTVPASSGGVVSSYAGANGEFVVLQSGTPISDQFTLATKSGGNPQNLTVSYNNAANPRTYTITSAGIGTGEFGNAALDGATLTIRATGSGAFAGIVIDKVFSIAKSRAGAAGAPGTDGTDGTDGADGANAKTMTMLSNRQTIAYDAAGAPTPTSQTTVFGTQKQNTSATVNWSITDAAGTAMTPTTTYLSAATGDSVSMTESQFAAARNGTSGVIVTASLTDGSTITDKISVTKVTEGAPGTDGSDGTDGTNGADGVSPILAVPTISNMLIRTYADGSAKPSQLPVVIGTVVSQAGSAIPITSLAINTQSNLAATEDDVNVTVSAISGTSGFVAYTVTAGGQTARVSVPYVTIPDGASGATAQGVDFTGAISGGSFTSATPTVAMNVPASGQINVAFYGEYYVTTPPGSFTGEFKLRYRINGGSYSDVSGSDTPGTEALFLNFGNPDNTTGTVNIGPISITGLTPGDTFELEFQYKKSTGTKTGSIGSALTLYAEQAP